MKQLGQVNLVNVTTAQRDALTGVANGDIIYNTTLAAIQVRKSGAWRVLGYGNPIARIMSVQTFR